MRKCLHCKQEFTPRVPYQRYCSASCRRAKTRQNGKGKYKAKPKFDKVCKVCGTAFQASNIRHLYCSDECRVKAHRDNDKKRKAIMKSSPPVDLKKYLVRGKIHYEGYGDLS